MDNTKRCISKNIIDHVDNVLDVETTYDARNGVTCVIVTPKLAAEEIRPDAV